MFRMFFASLVFISVDLLVLNGERLQLIEHVRQYLRERDTISRSSENFNWLGNSNKIGLGYNLLGASPICYTGPCQMNEFTHAIFKLNYSSPQLGGCTDKLIPNNVELDCLPHVTKSTSSETIDSAEKLHNSLSNKIEVSVGAKFKAVAFSYKYSREVKNTMDNILQKNQVALRTLVEVSYVKLSAFDLMMELSDNFRYVIDNMPCCEKDDLDAEDYIKEFIFDYFGVAYVKTILLGGIAQQNIFIDKEAKAKLEKTGIDVKHQAAVSFDQTMGSNIGGSVEFGPGTSSSETLSNHQNFTKEVKSSYTSMLGGTVGLNNFIEWSKSIPKNPVIIRQSIQDIFGLFEKRYFPDDTLIANKSELIQHYFNKYVQDSAYCYKSCGSNGAHGVCEPTGFFQLGICKCKPGWHGVDCSTTVEEQHKVLQGTICGFDRSFLTVNCGGLRPWKQCPSGWEKHNWPTDLTVCYKAYTEVGNPVHGTICGLHSSHKKYNFNLNIRCRNSDVRTGECPEDYRNFHGRQGRCTNSGSSYSCEAENVLCIATNAKNNSAGTLCGMQIEDSIDGPSCDGFHPGLRQCPPNYVAVRTAFSDYGFMVCVKTG